MSSFNEIEKENDPKNTIIKYTIELSEKTGRNTIVYYSGWLNTEDEEVSITSMDKNGFITLIKDLDKSKGLDLILHTPGGSIDATESIIDYIHAVFGDDIRAIIPQMAMSGGTMIACSCKEILMGRYSSLGPVDPQIVGIPAQSVIKEFELAKKEIVESPETLSFWELMINKYPANFLFECENAIEWSKDILQKSLEYSMFKNNENSEMIDKIMFELDSGDATKDHSRNISAEKCKEIGLNIKNIEEDKELQNLVLSIHYACLDYFNQKNTSKLYANQNNEFICFNLTDE